ncbi:MAG: class I SAM-dependent methyltransferase [Chloroflexi bacterium]|nr:class I SAM-dependent methyltransferase [Chloroflexota bacterium]
MGSFDITKLERGYGLGLDERLIEYPWLFSSLPSKEGNFLDAGSVLNFDYILSLPTLVQKKIFISTLAPEKHSFWNKSISYVYEDLRDICYKNNFFDWIVCLSVIEHIGLDNTKFYTNNPANDEQALDAYIVVIRELHRVLKPGGHLYLSVPFGSHRNYGWLQTFNSNMVDTVLDAFSPTSYTEHHFRYDSDGWKVSSRTESGACQYFDLYDKAREYQNGDPIAAGAVVCLELVK